MLESENSNCAQIEIMQPVSGFLKIHLVFTAFVNTACYIENEGVLSKQMGKILEKEKTVWNPVSPRTPIWGSPR